MTKSTKAQEPCPVETLAREAAALCRLRHHTASKAFADETNMGDTYANPLIYQRLDALETLAGYHQATSTLGSIYQLLIARNQHPAADLCYSKTARIPEADKEAAQQAETKAHLLIELALSALMQSMPADRDLDALGTWYWNADETPPAGLVLQRQLDTAPDIEKAA